MTAPENMPRIICFCPTTKMIRDGSMQITIPAIVSEIDWASTAFSMEIPI